jgi:hypothetical protein
VLLLFVYICYFIYSYVAVCMLCAVRSLILASLCYILIVLLVFLILFFVFFVLLYICFFCFIYSLFVVLFCVLFLPLCCLSTIFIQFYRPLPPTVNPIAVNKYYIISCHIRRRATSAGSAEKILMFTNVVPTQKVSCAVTIK